MKYVVKINDKELGSGIGTQAMGVIHKAMFRNEDKEVIIDKVDGDKLLGSWSMKYTQSEA
jgi:hypothetical protein